MAIYTKLRHDTIDTKTLYCYFKAKNGECTRGDRCKYSHRWSEGMQVAEAPMKNRDGVSVAGMNRRILEQSRTPHPTPRGAPTRNLKTDWRPLSASVPAPISAPAFAPADGISLYAALLVGSCMLPRDLPPPPISCGVIGDGRPSSMPL